MNITINLPTQPKAPPQKAQRTTYKNVATHVPAELKEQFHEFCYSIGTTPNRLLRTFIEATLKGVA